MESRGAAGSDDPLSSSSGGLWSLAPCHLRGKPLAVQVAGKEERIFYSRRLAGLVPSEVSTPKAGLLS